MRQPKVKATPGCTSFDVVVVHMEQDLPLGTRVTSFMCGIERGTPGTKQRGHLLGAVTDGSRMNDVDATAMHLLLESTEAATKDHSALANCTKPRQLYVAWTSVV
jgi:hypothetical protein